MKHILLVALLAVTATSMAQEKPETVDINTLLTEMTSSDREVTVVNFWATWCGPCVKELPLFETLNSKNDPSIKVLLVSLDLDLDPNPEKVYKFVERKKLQSEVLLLKEDNPNSWINKISEEWSGALPATLVINNKTGRRKFVEKQLHEGDLELLIKEVKTN